MRKRKVWDKNLLLRQHRFLPDLNGGMVTNSTSTDKKCPFTGLVSIRGRILTGTVVSTKMHRTLIIRREYLHFIPKYSRYEKRHKNLAAHVSPAFRVEDGDQVTVGQCRPLSKTVCCMPRAHGRILMIMIGPLQRSPCAPKNRQGGQAVQQVLNMELYHRFKFTACMAGSLGATKDFSM
jgi:ribosomal protein uS17